MFKKGDVFEGKYSYCEVRTDLELVKKYDVLRIEIIDVKGNIFSSRALYSFDRDARKFTYESGAVGFYDTKNDTFETIESLYEISVEGKIYPTIEVGSMKGVRDGDILQVRYCETRALPKGKSDGVVFNIYEATLHKRH